MTDQPPSLRALIVVDQEEHKARVVASLTERERCAVAVAIDPKTELRRLGADMLARLLRQDGFDAAAVVGARAALRELSRIRRLSVLVLDAGRDTRRMRHVARHARALHPGAPAILLTGDARPAPDWLGPAGAVLRKPVHYAELASALHSLVHDTSLVRW